MFYMMRGHGNIQDIQPMIQTFYPSERQYKQVDTLPETGITILSELSGGYGEAAVFVDGSEVLRRTAGIQDSEKGDRTALKKAVYLALSDFTGIRSPWGMLTGIRPARYIADNRGSDSDDTLVERLGTDLFVTREKALLAISVAERGKRILSDGVHSGKFSVYIGIPFCPSTCRYCSFTSFPIKKYLGRQMEYVDAVTQELDFIKSYGEKAKTGADVLYMGGGTPTSLDADVLKTLLGRIADRIDTKSLREYSVEAGRPDTITPEKLAILKEAGVTRISVNPQTLNQGTLDAIGRRHSVGDFYQAFRAAVEAGFGNINIDTILGLPGETLDDVKHTFESIGALMPASVTVHTLAAKRASGLMKDLREKGTNTSEETQTPETVQEMLRYASDYVKSLGMRPYYMYRQKNMLGNFENVGYAQDGYECLYNVLFMEEVQTILSAGAGSVTKFVENGRIQRVFNVKNVVEYLQRIDEMIERKLAVRT